VAESGLQMHSELSEQVVWSSEHRFAGCLDALAWRPDPQAPGGRVWVAIDWKTSRQLRPEYALQVAAYAKALQESTGVLIAEAQVVRLEKNSVGYETRLLARIDDCYTSFLQAAGLWRYLYGGLSAWDRVNKHKLLQQPPQQRSTPVVAPAVVGSATVAVAAAVVAVAAQPSLVSTPLKDSSANLPTTLPPPLPTSIATQSVESTSASVVFAKARRSRDSSKKTPTSKGRKKTST